jgi:phenylalanyl-tRNA synthetase alpha chain
MLTQVFTAYKKIELYLTIQHLKLIKHSMNALIDPIYTNIPKSIHDKIGKNLHNLKNHPIEIIKQHIYTYFNTLPYKFDIFDALPPYTSTVNNFDKLLIPINHPARSKSDTYYLNENTVLRTHTSCHQNDLLASGHTNFLVTGDVYRKDEIDKYHYPIFHQMEGVIKVEKEEVAKQELLNILTGLVNYLFPGCKYRVSDDYFPFTEPSFEIEVYYNDKWVEILGCGIMHQQILKNNNLEGKSYVAFGLGLERLAMILFCIPDIRYLWSTDSRFIDQFKEGKIVKFIPYSDLPSQYNDISFWIKDGGVKDGRWLIENDFYELLRDTCGEWIESVELKDSFVHPKTGKCSKMYRIMYSPNDGSLKNPAEFTRVCNELQEAVRSNIGKLDIVLR